MKIKSGIEELNMLLLGGFNPGDIVLVKFSESPLGRVFLNQIYGGERGLVLINTDIPPTEVVGNFKMIDAYSLERGIKPSPNSRVVPSASYINDISLDLSEELKKGNTDGVAIFTLSTLLEKNPKEAVFSFLEVFNGRIKNLGGILILFVDTTNIKPQDLRKVEAISNVQLSLERGEEGVMLKSNAFPLPLEMDMFSNEIVVR